MPKNWKQQSKMLGYTKSQLPIAEVLWKACRDVWSRLLNAMEDIQNIDCSMNSVKKACAYSVKAFDVGLFKQ